MLDCGSDKFTLFECPSCGALWAGHEVFWDHGTWYRKEIIRIANEEGFKELVASARAARATELHIVRLERGRLTTGDIARAMQIALRVAATRGES